MLRARMRGSPAVRRADASSSACEPQARRSHRERALGLALARRPAASRAISTCQVPPISSVEVRLVAAVAELGHVRGATHRRHRAHRVHVHLHVELGALDGAALRVAELDLELVLADTRRLRLDRGADLEPLRAHDAGLDGAGHTRTTSAATQSSPRRLHGVPPGSAPTARASSAERRLTSTSAFLVVELGVAQARSASINAEKSL